MKAVRLIISNPNFRNLWLAQISSQFAVNLLLLILALHVYNLTLKNSAVSVLAIGMAAPSVLGIIAGVIVDRFKKKDLLLATNILRAFFTFFLLFAVNSVFWLILSGIIISIISQFFIPAEVPSIPELVSKEDLITANSLFNFSFYSSTIVAFVLGGSIFKLFGLGIAVSLSGAFFLLAAVLITKMSKFGQVKKEVNFDIASLFSETKSQFTLLIGSGGIFKAVFLIGMVQGLLAVLMILSPGFAHHLLQVEIDQVSLLVLGPAALGLIAMSLFLSRFKSIEVRRAIRIGLLLISGSLMFLSAVPGLKNYFNLTVIDFFPVTILSMIILGFGLALISISATSVLLLQVEESMRGKIYGVLTTITGITTSIPMMIAGILADEIGISKVIFLISIFILGIWAKTISKNS